MRIFNKQAGQVYNFVKSKEVGRIKKLFIAMIWGLYSERYGPNIPFERDFNYTIEMYSKLGNLFKVLRTWFYW